MDMSLFLKDKKKNMQTLITEKEQHSYCEKK